MNTPIEGYFDRIFLVNLKRRTDRLEHALGVLAQLGISRDSVTLFEGYDKPIHDGKPNGNMGCTASHRALFEMIAYEKIPRALILEDDFDIACTGPDQRVKVDPQRLFESYIPELPSRWDLLYLGRHFAEMPISRRSPHVIRVARMHTTSTYAITAEHARRIAPYISGVGPIDVAISGFNRESECYCVDPTLFVQYTNMSDLSDQVDRNSNPMQDMNHIRALDRGTVYPPPPRQ